MRDKVSTKATAEAALRELPSVLGAFVREDVNGHPREVHLLITPGPNPRDLAHDIRALLQDRLGIQIDQRIISIAQLSRELDPVPPGIFLESPAAAAIESRTEVAELLAKAGPVMPRVVYQGLESSAREGWVEVRVRVTWQEREFVGQGRELDGGLGRIRAAASATLRAATAACKGRARFDLESAAATRALGREYVLIAALASGPTLGRRPLTLIGAQPLEFDAETTATLATLQAINRILATLLES
jgi:hypothetical protein